MVVWQRSDMEIPIRTALDITGNDEGNRHLDMQDCSEIDIGSIEIHAVYISYRQFICSYIICWDVLEFAINV